MGAPAFAWIVPLVGAALAGCEADAAGRPDWPVGLLDWQPVSMTLATRATPTFKRTTERLMASSFRIGGGALKGRSMLSALTDQRSGPAVPARDRQSSWIVNGRGKTSTEAMRCVQRTMTGYNGAKPGCP
jgi:hypothetical protein